MKRLFSILLTVILFCGIFACSDDPATSVNIPVADAGADQTVSVTDTVTLDGSASSDPEGTPVTCLWTITQRPAGSTAALSDSSSVSTTFKADTAGVYVISLIVTDGTDTSEPDYVNVTAVDNKYTGMKYVRGGPFYMGTAAGNIDEAPVHLVNIDDYFMDVDEVTVAKYRECVNAKVCLPPYKNSSLTIEHYFDSSDYDDYPVINVTHEDAKKYCEYAGKILPTEAMWEKAARGDTNFIYPWGNEIVSGAANYNGIVGDTKKTGSYSPGVSVYGMNDMSGNAAEWTQDYYSASYYETSPSDNPVGPLTGDFYVIRGGNFVSDQFDIRIVARAYFSKEAASDYIGFRCVVVPSE